MNERLNSDSAQEKESIAQRFLSNNLIKRAITGVVFVFVCIYSIIVDNTFVFLSFSSITSIIMLSEWLTIVRRAQKSKNVNNESETKSILYYEWMLVGAIYCLLYMMSLCAIYRESKVYLLYVFLMTWMSDVGCYIFGITFQGIKLCPKISKKKTVSGAIGGIIFTVICSYYFAHLLNDGNNLLHDIDYEASPQINAPILMGALLSIVGQIGDIAESIFKRIFNVKDSGRILPGHGGMMDRMDAVVFNSLFFSIYLTYFA